MTPTATLRSFEPGTTRRAALSAAVVLCLALFAGACGSSSSPSEPTSAVVTAESVEASSASLANRERGTDGLEMLWFDPVLSEIARQYSREMRDQGFVSHYDKNGIAVDGRLRVAGVSFTMAGENIATLGRTTDPAGEAHRGFMNSASHRANILDSRFTSVGVGMATDGDQFWITQVFIRE